jgi:hypothetical protein
MDSMLRVNSVVNIILISVLLIVVSLGCGGAPYTVPNAEYLGVWSDGNATFTFRPDGITEYSSPNLYLRENDTRIYSDGGSYFSLWNYDYKFKIDAEPKDNKMTLNGITYQKTGNNEPPPPSDKLKVPTDAEIEKIVKDMIGDYIKALEAGSLEQFLAAGEQELDNYDKDIFQKNFAEALAKKDNSLASLRDAQTKPVKFNRQPSMAITIQKGSFSFNDASFASQPLKTVVSGYFDLKKGKWQFSRFWVHFE